MSKHQALHAVEQAARAASDKKAADLTLLALDGATAFTNYFLICTAESARQAQAISDSVEKELRKAGWPPAQVEGYKNAEWVLLDFVDFVVHIFSPQARSFYDLERLWRRAAHLPVPEAKHSG